jgi:two-component system OmpR family sensor kinase
VRSLRRTLVVTLLGSVVAVTLVGGYATYRQARAGVDRIFDYHLRQIALSLRDQTWVQPDGAAGDPPDAEEGFDFVIQVWDAEGSRLYLSRPGTGLPEVATLGFATVPARSGPWRVYSVALGSFVIQVAQPLAVRDRLAFEAASRTLWPLLVLVPLLALLVWRVVDRGLGPLGRLARAAEARTPSALEPFPEEGVPEEVAPLVRSLNGLLDRLRGALAAQRAFVADAAHELRTPLAALKLQCQLAERAGSAPQRAAALKALGAGLERATYVVHQLLTLAREEPGGALPEGAGEVALGELVGAVVADHALLAKARGVDLGAGAVDEEARVRGDAASLRTLLSNLVDNAIRYGRRGGRVDVSAGVADGRPWLEVADDGPGIPVAERERVFDRFYRRAEGREQGTGLGLAIVRAIASRHGATVALGDAPRGGLAVRVAFPEGSGTLAPAPDRDATP